MWISKKTFNRRVSALVVATGLPLMAARLATSVRARANLGGNGWSPGGWGGGYMVAEDEGGWVSYCKSSNKAKRLPPVTGFNIRARILPESPLCQLKNVKHDLKGYYIAWWERGDILLFSLSVLFCQPFDFYNKSVYILSHIQPSFLVWQRDWRYSVWKERPAI